MRIVRPSRSIVFGALSLLFAGWIIISAAPPKNVDYPYYGGDPGAMRYSTLTQINAKNAAHLKEVWRYDLGGPATIENQPIVVNGILYGVGVTNDLCAGCGDRQSQMGVYSAADRGTQPARRNILDRRQRSALDRHEGQCDDRPECGHRQTHPGLR